MPSQRPKRRGRPRSTLRVSQVLAWADQFHKRLGRWPTILAGSIPGVPGETWRKADNALRLGLRGLPGGSSLAQLLARERGMRNPKGLPTLSYRQVLAWADAYHRRTGRWPKEISGPIPEAPGERWHAVDRAMRAGVRGLPGGLSLAQLLARERGVRNIQRLPRLTTAKILAWADAHRRRTGKWPSIVTGSVTDAPGETWSGIDTALKLGRRGLTPGTTLMRLLGQHRAVRNPRQLPPLSKKQILDWAKAWHERTGEWPNRTSGTIPGTLGETWSVVDRALKHGERGLTAGVSLFQLLRPYKRS